MQVIKTTSTNNLFGILLIALYPSVTWADQNVQILGGGETSRDASYVYAGRVAPLTGSQLGNGYVSRLWADWSAYRYEKNGITYSASAPGVEVALGIQDAKENFWWSAYGGITYRNTSISPNDIGSAVQGEKLRAKLQVEGEQTINPLWKISGNASYVIGQDAYWARARVYRDIGSNRQLGLELVTQGDNDYRLSQIGVVLSGLKLSNDVNMGIKIGGRKTEGLSTNAYAGIEFEHRF